MSLYNAKAEWDKLRAELIAQFPELEADDQALYDTLDGAADLTEAITAVVRSAEDDRCLATALNARIHEMVERCGRLEDRMERKRAAAAKVMEECGLKKVTAPDFTVSLAAGRPHVVITDETKLPATALLQPPPKPDKTYIAALLKDGEAVPGAELSNPQLHLVVRRS